MMGIQKDRIKFNVGGRIFETTATTLANAGRDSYFGPMFDDDWNLVTSQQEIFIDRNPDCFGVLLDFLRTGDLNVPGNMPDRLLRREAMFYGLIDHLRAVKSGPFDGNRLRLARSVTGRAPGDGTAIRAGPDGGCCVAHGSVVHVFDWALEEHPPIDLDYQRVNDMGWIDAENIIVSTCQRICRGDGGMGLFSSSSGELRCRFEVSHENQVKTYTAGALSFNPDDKVVFASCKGRSNEYGIGVWDQFTGKQVDFFYDDNINMPGTLGNADKLQWLNVRNCLLVATLFPRKDNCYISLLDFREKEKMVWSWSDIGSPPYPSMDRDEKRVRDTLAMEDNNSLCVVSGYEDLGFIDLRGKSSVRWRSGSRMMKGIMPDEPCYPKLALHQGQLFSSMNDCVSVFSGSEWILTSRLRRSYGGSICDFSIGGDRLFALHSEENVFDIWQTPSPPVM